MSVEKGKNTPNAKFDDVWTKMDATTELFVCRNIQVKNTLRRTVIIKYPIKYKGVFKEF